MENIEDIEITSKLGDAQLKKGRKEGDNVIKLFFFLMNAFFSALIIFFFIYFNKGIIEAYTNTPELIWVTIIISLRVVIMFTFCYIMFRKWYAQEKRYLKNMPFLVGLFYYFSAIGKLLDIVIYIYYCSPYVDQGELLLLTKIRYFFLIIVFLPMLFLGLRPVLYNFGFNRGWDDKKVLRVRKEIITVYACGFGVLIAIATSIEFITYILAIMSIFTYISIWSIFRFAHKYKTFPSIRADIVSWGFLFYIISSSSRALLSLFLSNIFSWAQIYAIGEILDFISITIIFFGFVLKSK
ncbi:MAG: hypothetical protein ACFFAN_01385 [Promethearchaeota archaeon]